MSPPEDLSTASPAGTQAGLLEEYRALQAEILAYGQQRTAVLATVVGAVGLLLVFGFEHSGDAAMVAYYTVLIAGVLVTWHGLYQATRRAAYIAVFLEPKIPGLSWYTLMRDEGLHPIQFLIARRRVRIRPATVPQEFPAIYLLLGFAGLVYAFLLWPAGTSKTSLVLAVIGFVLLTATVLTLQILNTAYGFARLADRWELIKQGHLDPEKHDNEASP